MVDGLPETATGVGGVTAWETSGFAQSTMPARASPITERSSLGVTLASPSTRVSTSGMFMPETTRTRGLRAISSTMALLTLEPSMSVRTKTSSSSANPSIKASTLPVIGSVSSRLRMTACTLGTSPTIMRIVSSAPSASSPWDARMTWFMKR